jgi:hypothetical protein
MHLIAARALIGWATDTFKRQTDIFSALGGQWTVRALFRCLLVKFRIALTGQREFNKKGVG